MTYIRHYLNAADGSKRDINRFPADGALYQPINTTALRKQWPARDKERVDFFRNTYKVLMTRGMKGCYVYFEDEEMGQFFRSRMKA